MHLHGSDADSDTESVLDNVTDSVSDSVNDFDFGLIKDNKGIITDDEYRRFSFTPKRDDGTFDFNIVERQVVKACKSLFKHPEHYTDEMINIVWHYYTSYRKYTGYVHPYIKQEHMNKVIGAFSDLCLEENDDDDIEAIIDEHFHTRYENCDYNIIHFASSNLLLNKLYHQGLI